MINTSSVELFELRKWLLIHINSNVKIINKEHFTKAQELLKNVDKELWGRYISSETPWGSSSIKFEDNDFEETLEETFGENK